MANPVVAQLSSVLRSGRRGRDFKSPTPSLAAGPRRLRPAGPGRRRAGPVRAQGGRGPGSVTEDDINALRELGFSDVDILDANNRTAHLNYTNRFANGLGLLSEPLDEERSLTRVPGFEEAEASTE